MWSLRFHWADWKGPRAGPIGAREKSWPPFWTAAIDSIIPARSTSVASRVASGLARWKVTWVSSTTSTEVTLLRSDLRRELVAVLYRWMLSFTDCALKGVPSWYLTPDCRVNLLFSGSETSQDLTSPGEILSEGSIVKSES